VPDELQPSGHPTRLAAIVIGSAVVVLAAVFALGPDAASPSSLSALPSIDGQVAAGNPPPAPPASIAQPREAAPSTSAFDSVITRQAPPGWKVTGGTAEVVPFPNSVDRSLRIATGGSAPSACMPMDIAERWRIAADVHLHGPAAVAISIGGGGGAATLYLGADGAARAEPGGSTARTPISTDEWYALSFEPTATGVDITMGQRGGGGRDLLTLTAGAQVPTGTGEVCFQIRSPTGEMHVDNVTIHGDA
jgi:hypothetical protein